MLYVQRKEQQAWLKQYQPDIIFVDSTHGTNNHNMQLYTAVIPYDAPQGLPAAFCLIYAPGKAMLMLQALHVTVLYYVHIYAALHWSMLSCSGCHQVYAPAVVFA